MDSFMFQLYRLSLVLTAALLRYLCPKISKVEVSSALVSVLMMPALPSLSTIRGYIKFIILKYIPKIFSIVETYIFINTFSVNTKSVVHCKMTRVFKRASVHLLYLHTMWLGPCMTTHHFIQRFLFISNIFLIQRTALISGSKHSMKKQLLFSIARCHGDFLFLCESFSQWRTSSPDDISCQLPGIITGRYKWDHDLVLQG